MGVSKRSSRSAEAEQLLKVCPTSEDNNNEKTPFLSKTVDLQDNPRPSTFD